MAYLIELHFAKEVQIYALGYPLIWCAQLVWIFKDSIRVDEYLPIWKCRYISTNKKFCIVCFGKFYNFLHSAIAVYDPFVLRETSQQQQEIPHQWGYFSSLILIRGSKRDQVTFVDIWHLFKSLLGPMRRHTVSNQKRKVHFFEEKYRVYMSLKFGIFGGSR